MDRRALWRWADIPYQTGGCSRQGADCYGLARLCAAEEFGVSLPYYPFGEIPEGCADGDARFSGWVEIPKPDWRAADLALFPAGDALHCALLLDDRRILNTSIMSVSHVADLAVEPYRSLLRGVYRWTPREN